MSGPLTGQSADTPDTSPGFDPSVPSPARMYDYYLGGKDNFPADREAAEQALSVVPFGREVARANRQFLARAVTFMARDGIGQFIDLGTGLPTRPNVHEVARSIQPDARVLYVDNDPMVCSHARALLATNDGVAAIQGDIRTPQAILNDPVTRTMIDFTRPVGVLFVAVLHFLTDDDQPWEQVAAFRWRMASGSMLAVSHITSDGTPPERPGHDPGRLRRGQRPGRVPDQAGDRELLRRPGPGRARPRGRRCLAQPAPISARAAAVPRRRGQDHPRLRATVSPAPAPALHPFQRAGMASDSLFVAAQQLPGTRRPADRGAVRPAARQASRVGMGIERHD